MSKEIDLTRASGRDRPLKTIFISLDTVSADRLSTLGGTRCSTPSLDLLAAESALFTNAYATDIPTQPSHTAVFTGSYGASTGIISHFHPPAQLADAGALAALDSCTTADAGPVAVDHLFVMKEWFERGYEDYMSLPDGRARPPLS